MNLIVTSACNKNCSFCFAGNKDKKIELSFEEIKRIVSKAKENESIKLLGGEPTLYENLEQLLEYLTTVPNNVTIISNFLIYKDEVRNTIKNFVEKKKDVSFLLNVAELTEKQFNTVVENINYITKDYSISLGFTIDLKRDINEYKNTIKGIYESCKNKISTLRLSVPFPNFSNENYKERIFYLYKDYRYADTIEELIRYGLTFDLFSTIDCGLFPCMIRDEKQEKYFRDRVKDFKLGCTGGAFDVFSEKKASLCYPGNFIEVNLEKHKDTNSAFEELILKKRYQYAIKDNLPEECKGCKYLGNKCAGPCLGFVKVGE